MRIAVENSSWNNIGDGFYQFSLYYLLLREFPQHQVSFLNAPTSRSFRVTERFLGNVFDPEHIQDADLYVLSGPILNSSFMKDYGKLIRDLSARGKRYALISVHGGAEPAKELQPFLEKYPPVILASRDRLTYDNYKNCSFPTYDGVCTASLVSITCQVVGDTLKDRPYIASSFYEGYEPEFQITENAQGEIIDVQGIETWKPEPNWGRVRHVEWMTKRYPERKGRYEIIRPVHDIAYKFSHLNFARKNSFLSYNPFVYLELYKGAAVTVTNRLHAALPTLSYGRPVAYVGRTARNGAIDRLGLRDYQGKFMRLDPEVPRREYAALVDALKAAGI